MPSFKKVLIRQAQINSTYPARGGYPIIKKLIYLNTYIYFSASLTSSAVSLTFFPSFEAFAS